VDRSELTLCRGEGYRVWDIDGREYIDCASLNTTCGYGREEIVAAVSSQMRRFFGTDISIASHDVVGALAERIAGFLPGTLSKTLFVNSGSEAFEAAVFLATCYWRHQGQQRSRLVTFARGYHGSTLVSRNLTALPRVGHPFASPFPVTHVELPYPARDMRTAEAQERLLAAFRAAIRSDPADPPVAVIVEPMLNVGGGIVLPEGFLPALRKLCDEENVLLVVDEVFTAYGRCGHMFACQGAGIEPDILVSSKGLASGYVPIGAVTVRQHIHDSFAQDPHIAGLRYGHTTSGHAVACAAALATLDILVTDKLDEKARSAGSFLRKTFGQLTEAEGVVDVRGLGLIVVVEMDSAPRAEQVMTNARRTGLLMRQSGEAIMICPPLIVDEPGLQEIATRFVNAVRAGK
jgi:adenosylmethionine-8-amino-7-oxononanoate aminotransferase